MSFEDKLNKRLLSEAPQGPGQGAVRHPNPQRYALQRKQSRAQQGPDPDFAAVRKSLRRPMVAMDAAIHKIDQLLNTSQQDPSQLGNLVTQIEQSFNAIFNPLKAVRSGVADLRKAADTFNADYVGQKQQQPQQAPAEQGKIEPGVDEDRYLNRIATEVEMSNRQEDKMSAAKAGFDSYKSQGGKMNRGEFFRRLVQKLRLPGEAQEPEEQRRLPNVGASKRYGEVGKRQGELQFKPGRVSPVESVQHDLGQLIPKANEDQILNKVTTEIEMVNNPADKQMSLRNGWLEYKQAGGRMNYAEFSKAILSKLSQALPQESSAQRRRTV